MRREAQQRQEVCRYPKYRPCCCERRQLWAAPTLCRCGDSGRNCRHGRSRTSLHPALNPAARVESAPLGSEHFSNPGVPPSAKRLISAIGAGIPFTFVLVRCPLDLVVRKPQSLQFHTVWLCCGRRLAISFRWLRQRRDPGLFCFPELGIPHTFECPL